MDKLEEYYATYCNIVQIFVEARGQKVISVNESGMVVEKQNGELYTISRTKIFFFMGFSEATLEKFFGEVKK